MSEIIMLDALVVIKTKDELIGDIIMLLAVTCQKRYRSPAVRWN